MEENGGNEGKNLAVFEKAKANFEAAVAEAIRDMGDDTDYVNINNVTLTVSKKDDGVFSICFGKDELCTMGPNDEFNYNLDQLRQYEEARRDGEWGTADIMNSMGFPSVDDLSAYLEKEKNRRLEEEQQRLEEQGDEENVEQDKGGRERTQEGEKGTKEDKDEKPKQDQVSFKDAIEAKAKELNMSTSNFKNAMTELELDRNRVTRNQTLGQILNIEGSRLFVVKVNETNWRLLATDANGNLYDLAEQTELKGGMNNRTRTSLEGERGLSQGSLQETQYLAEFSIKDSAGAEHRIAIQREGEGSGAHIQALYGRVQTDRGVNDEDSVTYTSIATKDGYDRIQASSETRDQLDPQNTTTLRMHAEATLKDRYEQVLKDIPEFDDGTQMNEYDLDTYQARFKEKEIPRLKSQGVDFPGKAEAMAEEVAYKVFVEGKRILDAEREVMDPEREKGGTTPEDKRKRDE